MQTSINLLKQFGNITEPSEKIIDLIKTNIGAVESSHNIENDYKNIVIAEIVEKENHPDSDKLGIYQINCGEEKLIQVVAGDRSLNIKDKVAYLKPGAVVPYSIYSQAEPFVIKEIKLRGVMSYGMMASERELNISNEHERVFKLPNDAPVGTSFSEYFELNDTVVDIENKALTNRGDLFSIIGISRELTAITGNKFESPKWYKEKALNLEIETTTLPLEIKNDTEATCPRYTAIVLDDIEIKDSPVWLKSTLIKSNIKPINNIVDITNYVATLVGQPLHAFDYDKLVKNDPSGKAYITVRMAQEGESLLCLDDKLHNLDSSVMVIADSTHPLAIAGIIGGKDIEIDDNTKRIIIESANFEKTNIRRSSMKLGLFTDAATRYKHALDPLNCLVGLGKAVELCKDLANAKIASNIIDINYTKEERKSLSLNLEKLNIHLGTELNEKEVVNILTNLEYEIETSNETDITVLVPSWRKDVNIKEDIHEDIGRVYGFNNIKLQLPNKEISPLRKNSVFEMKKRIRNLLSIQGGNETLNYNFTNIETLSLCNLSADLAYKIKNPLAPELSLMRTSLLPSLIKKTEENLQRGFESFMLYEVNIAHIKGEVDKDNLPNEDWLVSGVFTMKSNSKNSTSTYYKVKKILDNMFLGLDIKGVRYELVGDCTEQNLPAFLKNDINMFEPNASALILFQENYLGVVGVLKDSIQSNFKLSSNPTAFEISISPLLELENGNVKHKDTPIYPIFTQDLCFEIEKNIKYIDLKDTIEKSLIDDTIWGRVECLDIYSNTDLKDRKRITFRITASNYEKTLNEKDIKAIIEKITNSVKKNFSAIVI